MPGALELSKLISYANRKVTSNAKRKSKMRATHAREILLIFHLKLKRFKVCKNARGNFYLEFLKLPLAPVSSAASVPPSVAAF